MLNFFSSLKLTLAVLLGLALLASGGTVAPQIEGRYDLYYQSLWFRLGLGLLALNLAVCTLKTIRRNLEDRRRHLEVLSSEQLFAQPLRYLLPHERPLDSFASGLRRAGYRVETGTGGQLLARRGMAGRWGSTLVHLSVLLIMLGALLAQLGFVGTLNLYVNDQTDKYFDWSKQDEQPLGFTFRLDAFEPQYYPIAVQFVAIDPASRQVIATLTAREGETVLLPGGELRAKVMRFFPFEEDLVLGLYRRDSYLGEYHALGGQQLLRNTFDPGFELRPAAFRDPIIRQLHSEVAILEGERVVQRGVIEVNSPLTYRGIKIYQTAYTRDKFGFWAAGFQLSRDPGEPLVWFGCITLVIALLAAFTIPYRAVGISRHEGETFLVALSGFSGEGGGKAFDALEQGLTIEEKNT
ncbi:MAG: hypothetical protein A2091_00840 [Desulfuromonadales bacterium GWD2_61_12]|nr:MAG: hypothetical protein A2005_02250 [Desulfuromonadales bacterium GWC2_61_20]OGR36254.1 MAG: hypothetical protein A2091_00840 [Desulfuromonadales bacterium GWD2_61_12]HAD03439.1 hypothetical protein [Desulfuromonas sp.]HBT82067.1 hypothetical protein [Desulfuromonas sp.]